MNQPTWQPGNSPAEQTALQAAGQPGSPAERQAARPAQPAQPEQAAMSHEQAREELSALMDGELNEQERRSLYWHVRSCEACQSYLKELMELRAALSEPEEVRVPAGFARSVMERLREERSAADFAERWESSLHPKREKQTTRSRLGRWAAWGACAAAVLLMLTAALRMNGGGRTADSAMVRGDSAPAAAAGSGIAEAKQEAAEAETPAAPMAKQTAEESARLPDDYAAEAAGDEADAGGGTALRMAGAAQETAENGAAAYGAGETAPSAAEADSGAAASTAPAGSNGTDGVAAEGPEAVLLGEGAADWLVRNGWQGESGDWYADAAALRELPDGLSLQAPLPSLWSGPVRVETGEARR